MAQYDPVQEYLNRLRAMNPNEKLSRDIDELEQEHKRSQSKAASKRVRPGFRSSKDR